MYGKATHISPQGRISIGTIISKYYWVIQAEFLTFAWHRLSPLAAFTSGAYFLHNGRR